MYAEMKYTYHERRTCSVEYADHTALVLWVSLIILIYIIRSHWDNDNDNEFKQEVYNIPQLGSELKSTAYVLAVATTPSVSTRSIVPMHTAVYQTIIPHTVILLSQNNANHEQRNTTHLLDNRVAV